jgi:dienelactone hydrolase
MAPGIVSIVAGASRTKCPGSCARPSLLLQSKISGGPVNVPCRYQKTRPAWGASLLLLVLLIAGCASHRGAAGASGVVAYENGLWFDAGPVVIHFPTADGGVVHADLYGRGNHVVVLAHGGRFTKKSWKEQAIRLAEAGFRVIAIDFRGRGESRGGPASTGEEKELSLDVLAAVRHARESGATTVAVVGASFGGWAAAGASAEAPGEIDRLVILAGVVDEPEKLTGRKLFILSRDDVRGGGILRLPEIRDQYERAPEPKELVVLEGSAHAQFIFETDQSERLMNEILRFLTE